MKKEKKIICDVLVNDFLKIIYREYNLETDDILHRIMDNDSEESVNGFGAFLENLYQDRGVDFMEKLGYKTCNKYYKECYEYVLCQVRNDLIEYY